MGGPLPPEKEAAIRALLPRNKIQAIKLYREATGVGLAEAKEAVEKMTGEVQATGGLPSNAPAKGCFGLIVAGALILATVATRYAFN
jgi:hypothetical protein